MAGALAFCHPSVNESFGIVLLESWLARTPALVHAGSDVLQHAFDGLERVRLVGADDARRPALDPPGAIEAVDRLVGLEHHDAPLVVRDDTPVRQSIRRL